MLPIPTSSLAAEQSFMSTRKGQFIFAATFTRKFTSQSRLPWITCKWYYESHVNDIIRTGNLFQQNNQTFTLIQPVTLRLSNRNENRLRNKIIFHSRTASSTWRRGSSPGPRLRPWSAWTLSWSLPSRSVGHRLCWSKKLLRERLKEPFESTRTQRK